MLLGIHLTFFNLNKNHFKIWNRSENINYKT